MNAAAQGVHGFLKSAGIGLNVFTTNRDSSVERVQISLSLSLPLLYVMLYIS